MRSLNFILLILFVISFDLVSSDQAYGTSCTLKNGSSGTCSPISNCLEIRKLLADWKISRKEIVICNKPLRYLCCPLALPSPEVLSEVEKPSVENDQYYPCGSSGRPISLVINGTQSERGAWPWLVTLYRFQTNDLFCGGTLISSNAVITVSFK